MLPCLDLSPGEQYYQFARPDVLALIPREARRLLDVGCGAGALGETVLARQDCFYCGIEPDDKAAAAAHRRLTRVYHTTIEHFNEPNLLGFFDCIILSDILEHTVDPLFVLHHCCEYLSHDGILILSVPNLAHPQIVRELSSGLFRYRFAGILDNSHLRHFTYITIQQLLAAAGLHVSSMRLQPSDRDPQQFLIVCRPVEYDNFKADLGILVPHYQTLPYLKNLIESVRQSTLENSQIYVLDQASTPESRSWLADQTDIISIDSPLNFGFPIACNLLLASCPCDWILLCNSDIYFPRDSLAQLLAAARLLGEKSITGPVAPNVSGPQFHHQPHSTKPEFLNSYASKVFSERAFEKILTHRLVFFCTIFHSSAFKTVGLLDEIFTPGNYEDDDFCLRAILAGFKCHYLPGVYVHHYGSATFNSHALDKQSIMQRNLQYFKLLHARHLQTTLERYYSRR